MQLNLRKGVRYSTSTAYLKPAMKKYKNLTVRTGVQVTKVIIKDKKAVGVAFKTQLVGLYNRLTLSSPQDQERTISCSGEVILCCGAVGTPHLLMLSGIGPKAELEKFNIPVEMDLPGVGQNLQDHTFVFEMYPTKTPIGYCLPRDEVWTYFSFSYS